MSKQMVSKPGLLLRRVVWSGLFLISTAFSVAAQNYSIDWLTVDGGGGTSTGGAYTVSATVGQPDASRTTLTGGNYSLQGGFWPGLMVPPTGEAPTLFIQLSGDSAVISWSPATPGFTLQQTDSLTSPAWSPAPAGNPTSPLPAGVGTRYYRLLKP